MHHATPTMNTTNLAARSEGMAYFGGCLPLASTEIFQEHHYYPFGLEMERGNAVGGAGAEQRYRYNGKEVIEEVGLYEYGFRWYDPAIGRFTGVDPISDQFAWVSVYNYAENEPIANIDLHGLQRFNAVKSSLISMAQGVRDWVQEKTGINIALTGTSSPSPVKTLSVKAQVEGNIQVGMGMGAEVNVMGTKAEVSADIGSVRVVEGDVTLSSEGLDANGNLADRDNNTFERNGGVEVSLPGDVVSVGGGFEETQVERGGKVISETRKLEAGATVNGKFYGTSSTSDAVDPNTSSTAFEFGVGGQLIIGGEIKAKLIIETKVYNPREQKE